MTRLLLCAAALMLICLGLGGCIDFAPAPESERLPPAWLQSVDGGEYHYDQFGKTIVLRSGNWLIANETQTTELGLEASGNSMLTVRDSTMELGRRGWVIYVASLLVENTTLSGGSLSCYGATEVLFRNATIHQSDVQLGGLCGKKIFEDTPELPAILDNATITGSHNIVKIDARSRHVSGDGGALGIGFYGAVDNAHESIKALIARHGVALYSHPTQANEYSHGIEVEVQDRDSDRTFLASEVPTLVKPITANSKNVHFEGWIDLTQQNGYRRLGWEYPVQTVALLHPDTDCMASDEWIITGTGRGVNLIKDHRALGESQLELALTYHAAQSHEVRPEPFDWNHMGEITLPAFRSICEVAGRTPVERAMIALFMDSESGSFMACESLQDTDRLEPFWLPRLTGHSFDEWVEQCNDELPSIAPPNR